MTGRAIPIVDATAPPERLAAFRVLTGAFTVIYLVVRAPVFWQLSNRPPQGFDGVGVFSRLSDPLSGSVPPVLHLVAIIAGVAATLGVRYRVTAKVFAGSVLALTSYRASWGQLLHFENLFTLHLLILAFAPAADRFVSRRLDSKRAHPRADRPSVSYGFPLALAGLIVVVTYVLAGVAKLRIGGLEWVTGDTLLHHISYSAARSELLGGTPSPFAGWATSMPWMLHWTAAAALLVELGAPLALLGGRVRTTWVVGAWLLHAGTLLFMFIVFPYPLALVAFAPFFPLERLVDGARFRRPNTY